MDLLQTLALILLALLIAASVLAGMIVWIAAMLDVELVGDEEVRDDA